MRKTLSRFSELFQVRYAYPNLLDQQQARGLLRISIILIIGLVFGFLAEFLNEPRSTVVYILNQPVPFSQYLFAINYAIAAFLFVITITNVNRGAIQNARVIFVSGLIFVSVVYYLLSGIYTLSSVVLALPLIGAGVLLRRRGFWFTSLIVVGFVILWILFLQSGLLLIKSAESTSANDLVFFIFPVLAAIAIMLAGFASNQLVLLERNLTLAEELRGFTAISGVITVADNPSGMLTQVTETIRDRLGYYHVQVFIVEEQAGIVSLAATTSINRTDEDNTPRRFPLNSASVIADVIRSQQPTRLSMNSPVAQRSEFLSATRAQLLVPIKHGRAVLGVLDMQSVHSDAFSAQDVAAFEAIASEVAFALENLRLLEEKKQTERERTEMDDQNRQLSREVERLNQEISGRAWTRFLESRPDRLIGYDARDGLISVNMSEIPTPSALSPYTETRNGAHILRVPIVLRGQLLGMMEFTAQDGQTWDVKSVELSRAIAQRLALSLENLRLFEQAQMAVAREQVANQVSTLLQARSDVDSLIAVAADVFQQALGAAYTNIRLGVPDAENTKIEASEPQKLESPNGNAKNRDLQR